MSQILPLGAINRDTGEFVIPKMANRIDNYICPDCKGDVIPCLGEIRVHHYRHKVDINNPCNRYSNPTESEIHEDGKRIMKNLLETKKNIVICRMCPSCKKIEEWKLCEKTETTTIEIEHPFKYNGDKKADVARIDDGEVTCIHEIFHTNRTSNENRPEPWFEHEPKSLIQIANDSQSDSIQIPCVRQEKCEVCVEKEIRLKKIKIINDKKEALNKLISNEKKEYFKPDFDMNTSPTENKKRRKLQRKNIENWNEEIKKLDEELNELNVIIITQQDKIEILTKEYNNISRPWRGNIDIDDDADTFRSMRYHKQDRNDEKVFEMKKILIEHGITFKLGNNVVDIKHPKFDTKICRSLVKNKTRFNGKWIDNISIELIIDWYQETKYDLLEKLNSMGRFI